MFLVITFMVAVGGLAAWTTYLQQVASRELRVTQGLFLRTLADRDTAAREEREAQEQAAAEERAAVADRYETFLDKQAEIEQGVTQIDDKWLASPDSEIDADPDIDWEAEPS